MIIDQIDTLLLRRMLKDVNKTQSKCLLGDPHYTNFHKNNFKLKSYIIHGHISKFELGTSKVKIRSLNPYLEN